MNWFKRNWKTLAGVACGAGSVAVGVFVNPVAGAALGAVCGGVFGAKATGIGQSVANNVRDVLAEAKKSEAPKDK
jgi:hypothetical protein